MIGNLDDETNFPHKLFLLTDKLQIFVELLLNTHQLISNRQKLNNLR